MAKEKDRGKNMPARRDDAPLATKEKATDLARPEVLQARVLGWKLEIHPLTKFRPIPGNPRKWTASQLGHLKASILRHGVYQPMVANEETGHIVAGNMRWEALRKLGVKKAPFLIGTLTADEEAIICANANNRRAQGRWKREDARAWVADIEKRDRSIAVQLGLDGIIQEIQDEEAVAAAGADDKKHVEFDAGKEKWGKLKVKLPPGVLEIVHQKLDRIAVLNGWGDKAADVARGLAMEIVFADLETDTFTPDKQRPMEPTEG
jgi:hypothetical protein